MNENRVITLIELDGLACGPCICPMGWPGPDTKPRLGQDSKPIIRLMFPCLSASVWPDQTIHINSSTWKRQPTVLLCCFLFGIRKLSLHTYFTRQIDQGTNRPFDACYSVAVGDNIISFSHLISPDHKITKFYQFYSFIALSF